jgi:hypothetical protein
MVSSTAIRDTFMDILLRARPEEAADEPEIDRGSGLYMSAVRFCIDLQRHCI